MEKNLYFVFSSVTFLQLYIPIVIKGNENGFSSIFIIRKNNKTYADPFCHNKLVQEFIEKYNIKLINSSDEFPIGIYFVVDGDIYGPPREDILRQSLIYKIKNNSNNIIINLNENMNFIDKYDIIQKNCDYCFFESNDLIKFWEKIDYNNYIKRNMLEFQGNKFTKIYDSSKNIYGINTKFDNIFNGDIHHKFNLPKMNSKYCLFLYPKLISFTDSDILNIYSHLRNLGYKIIVKTRPKSAHLIKNKELKGDYYIESDIYPNETLMLLSISELCIFSSSSAQSECLYSSVPCLDLESEIRQKWAGFEFLVDNKFYKQLKNNEWKGISYDTFKIIIDSLEYKHSEYINILRDNYFKIDDSKASLFTNSLKVDSSNYIINFIKKLIE